jgi:hypothetical protein
MPSQAGLNMATGNIALEYVITQIKEGVNLFIVKFAERNYGENLIM